MADDQHQKQFQLLGNVCKLSLAHTFIRRLRIMGDDQQWRYSLTLLIFCNLI